MGKAQALTSRLYHTDSLRFARLLHARREEIGRKDRNDKLDGPKARLRALCCDEGDVLGLGLDDADVMDLCMMLGLHHDGHLTIDGEAIYLHLGAISCNQHRLLF